MDGSAASNNQQSIIPQQQSSLIRTDQVQKLPHLNDPQKAQHTQVVRSLWDLINNRDPQSAEYQNAHMKLTQLSTNLMKGMRVYQQNRQQQQQQAMQQQAQAAAVAQGQRTQASNPQSFNQLLPAVQQKVSSLTFFLPPTINKEQTQTWLPEAKLRYGLALQKQELGKARMSEYRQQYNQRQSSGSLSQEDAQDFKTRMATAERIFREGSDFLTKFKEQQESFKAQQNQQLNRVTAPGQGQSSQGTGDQTTANPAAGGDSRLVNTAAQGQSAQAPAPPPHTINSAVNAARNQAAMSPTTSQPSQTPTSQTQGPASATSQAPAPNQPAFNQTSNQQTDAMATPGGNNQLANPQGPPRALSHQAAMAQAAQNYSNNVNQQNVAQPAANQHAHPTGYVQHRSAENSTRNVNMAIPKNLNVSPPEAVTVVSARPTLSGGPSHSAMGVMGQPAIQKHPGYVLEGEGQRVLSKKMLDILVRQVTGGGEGEGLTPDAEEFILQMADDFVDDVITAACRLAKLRPSSTLEIRDIQLVLERNYNMRISGFSTDDLRTVKKPQPAQGWTQKMSAVQAAKVTQGKAE
ncbi:Transcription initiation factor TFIID subunit A domain containing protein [Elaphomyces granulatus]|jgi:transcription initiation factor TFIID subunit 12